jgi:hypothetical protein
MGRGFEDFTPPKEVVATPEAQPSHGGGTVDDIARAPSLEADPASSAAALGSGERWVLFKMNVELGDQTLELTCHHGDIAVEVSSQFCLAHGLGDEVVPVLAASIQEQIDACLISKSKSSD